jgi:hypothetical protein
VLLEEGAAFGGGVGDKICKTVDRVDAAAVVVGAHRKSALAEFIMGSISNFLVHQCSVPVAVLHAPRAEVASCLVACRVPCYLYCPSMQACSLGCKRIAFTIAVARICVHATSASYLFSGTVYIVQVSMLNSLETLTDHFQLSHGLRGHKF